MAHWYVVGVLVLGAASGLAYYVWDLTRSYLDLQDKCFSQGREITRLSQERFDLQGKLMQAEQANAGAFNQAEIWRHQETDLRGQLARLRDEAHKHKTDFIQANNEWDAQKSNLLAQLSQAKDEANKHERECQRLQARLKIDEQNTEQWVNAATVASDRVAKLVETIAQHERILAAARDDISKVHHALGGSPVLRPRAEESEA